MATHHPCPLGLGPQRKKNKSNGSSTVNGPALRGRDGSEHSAGEFLGDFDEPNVRSSATGPHA